MKELMLALITVVSMFSCAGLVIEGHPWFGGAFLGFGFYICLIVLGAAHDEW